MPRTIDLGDVIEGVASTNVATMRTPEMPGQALGAKAIPHVEQSPHWACVPGCETGAAGTEGIAPDSAAVQRSGKKSPPAIARRACAPSGVTTMSDASNTHRIILAVEDSARIRTSMARSLYAGTGAKTVS